MLMSAMLMSIGFKVSRSLRQTGRMTHLAGSTRYISLSNGWSMTRRFRITLASSTYGTLEGPQGGIGAEGPATPVRADDALLEVYAVGLPHTVIEGRAGSFTVLLSKETHWFREAWPELWPYTSTPSIVTFCVMGMVEFAFRAEAGRAKARTTAQTRPNFAMSFDGKIWKEAAK